VGRHILGSLDGNLQRVLDETAAPCRRSGGVVYLGSGTSLVPVSDSIVAELRRAFRW